MAELAEAYNPLVPSECEELMKEFMVWVLKCDEMKKLCDTATGETKEAYAAVYRDFLWKLQARAGKLFFYLTGRSELNPFEIKRPETSNAASDVNHTG